MNDLETPFLNPLAGEAHGPAKEPTPSHRNNIDASSTRSLVPRCLHRSISILNFSCLIGLLLLLGSGRLVLVDRRHHDEPNNPKNPTFKTECMHPMGGGTVRRHERRCSQNLRSVPLYCKRKHGVWIGRALVSSFVATIDSLGKITPDCTAVISLWEPCSNNSTHRYISIHQNSCGYLDALHRARTFCSAT